MEDYVYAVKDGVTYILAQALCAKVLGDETEIAKTVKGQELVGMDYEPLYPFAGQTKQRGWYVVADRLCHADRWYRHRSYRACLW